MTRSKSPLARRAFDAVRLGVVAVVMVGVIAVELIGEWRKS